MAFQNDQNGPNEKVTKMTKMIEMTKMLNMYFLAWISLGFFSFIIFFKRILQSSLNNKIRAGHNIDKNIRNVKKLVRFFLTCTSYRVSRNSLVTLYFLNYSKLKIFKNEISMFPEFPEA